MDYRTLLKKYMRHIMDCESFSYIDRYPEPGGSVTFTDAELAELKKIEGEETGRSR